MFVALVLFSPTNPLARPPDPLSASLRALGRVECRADATGHRATAL